MPMHVSDSVSDLGDAAHNRAAFRLQGLTCIVLPELEKPPSGESPLVMGRLNLNGRKYVVLVDQTGQAPPVNDAVAALTRRELEIALLVAAGKPNKQIARQLGLSIWTVSTYLKRSFDKLRVSTRAELTARILGSISQPELSIRSRPPVGSGQGGAGNTPRAG